MQTFKRRSRVLGSGQLTPSLRWIVAASITLLACATTAAHAAGSGIVAGERPGVSSVVNVYSARHYDTDDALFRRFTRETGIEINLIEGNADQLIQRIEREGELSPADVFIAVDAARLYRAEEKDLFDSVRSSTLERRIPAERRHPEGLWFGITERARVIVASRERVEPGEVARYEDLADLVWRGRVLVRSSSNVYNQSLVAGLVSTLGESTTEAWCRGLARNLARTPQGGDRDQIRAIAAGEGDVAIVNHYYLARMIAGNEQDQAAASAVRIVFPNQDDRGAHVNVCGAGVVRGAPNRENAIRFIEFLISDEAQEALASQNFEFPVVKGIGLNPVLDEFGSFKAEKLVVSELGRNNRKAVQIMDRAAWR